MATTHDMFHILIARLRNTKNGKHILEPCPALHKAKTQNETSHTYNKIRKCSCRDHELATGMVEVLSYFQETLPTQLKEMGTSQVQRCWWQRLGWYCISKKMSGWTTYSAITHNRLLVRYVNWASFVQNILESLVRMKLALSEAISRPRSYKFQLCFRALMFLEAFMRQTWSLPSPTTMVVCMCHTVFIWEIIDLNAGTWEAELGTIQNALQA